MKIGAIFIQKNGKGEAGISHTWFLAEVFDNRLSEF